MSTQQFIKDRARGRPGQHYVAEMFRSWGATVDEVSDGYFTDYDIVANGKTIEVKYDIRASQTHNLCLELDALYHSKAQWLAIVTDHPRTVYLTPLQEALSLAQNWPRKKIVGERGEVAALVSIKSFISFLNPQVLVANQ